MRDLLTIIAIVVVFAIGCVAGHYQGKAEVYEKMITTTDFIAVNPVHMEKVK